MSASVGGPRPYSPGMRWWSRRPQAPSLSPEERLRRAARHVGSDPTVWGEPDLNAGDLHIGDRVKIWSGDRRTSIGGPGRIRLGHNVFLNSGVILYSEVSITLGDDVALSNDVYVMDTDSHGIEGRPPRAAAVSIGRGSWVGARSIVLPGVSIGEQVVVAAGSVVTRDVPDHVLVGGNPARVIRSLTYPEHCRRAWHDQWCYCPGSVLGPPITT